MDTTPYDGDAGSKSEGHHLANAQGEPSMLQFSENRDGDGSVSSNVAVTLEDALRNAAANIDAATRSKADGDMPHTMLSPFKLEKLNARLEGSPNSRVLSHFKGSSSFVFGHFEALIQLAYKSDLNPTWTGKALPFVDFREAKALPLGSSTAGSISDGRGWEKSHKENILNHIEEFVRQCRSGTNNDLLNQVTSPICRALVNFAPLQAERFGADKFNDMLGNLLLPQFVRYTSDVLTEVTVDKPEVRQTSIRQLLLSNFDNDSDACTAFMTAVDWSFDLDKEYALPLVDNEVRLYVPHTLLHTNADWHVKQIKLMMHSRLKKLAANAVFDLADLAEKMEDVCSYTYALVFTSLSSYTDIVGRVSAALKQMLPEKWTPFKEETGEEDSDSGESEDISSYVLRSTPSRLSSSSQQGSTSDDTSHDGSHHSAMVPYTHYTLKRTREPCVNVVMACLETDGENAPIVLSSHPMITDVGHIIFVGRASMTFAPPKSSQGTELVDLEHTVLRRLENSWGGPAGETTHFFVKDVIVQPRAKCPLKHVFWFHPQLCTDVWGTSPNFWTLWTTKRQRSAKDSIGTFQAQVMGFYDKFKRECRHARVVIDTWTGECLSNVLSKQETVSAVILPIEAERKDLAMDDLAKRFTDLKSDAPSSSREDGGDVVLSLDSKILKHVFPSVHGSISDVINPVTDDKPLKIISFNVQRNISLDVDLEKLCGVFETADVILLQEMWATVCSREVKHGKCTPAGEHNAKFLSLMLDRGFGVCFSKRPTGVGHFLSKENPEHGCILWKKTRLQLRTSGFLDRQLRHPSPANGEFRYRYVPYGAIFNVAIKHLRNRHPLTVVSCHLTPGKDTEAKYRRRSEISRAMQYIIERCQKKSLWLLGGDMNTVKSELQDISGSENFARILSNNKTTHANKLFQSTNAGNTNPFDNFDYPMDIGLLEVCDFEVLKDSPFNASCSDHFPVQVTMRPSADRSSLTARRTNPKRECVKRLRR